MELEQVRPGVDPERLRQALNWFALQAARLGYGSVQLVGRIVYGIPPADGSSTARGVVGAVTDEMDEWMRGER